MGPYDDVEIQIARSGAEGSGVALRGNANAPAIGDARGNANLDGFRATHAALAAASLAGGAKFAGAAAARARDVEAHLSGGLLNGAFAFAGGAHLRTAHGAGAVASVAGVHASDLHFLDGAANGVPEIDLDLVFKVAAALGFHFGRGGAATAAEELSKEIAEAGAASSASAAEIEPAEIEIDALISRLRPLAVTFGRKILTVEAVLVIHLALFGVGENVVGFLKLLEFFLGSLVTGIEVGVVSARELAKGGANVLGARFAGDAEEFVVVGFGGGRHLAKTSLPGCAHQAHEPKGIRFTARAACGGRGGFEPAPSSTMAAPDGACFSWGASCHRRRRIRHRSRPRAFHRRPVPEDRTRPSRSQRRFLPPDPRRRPGPSCRAFPRACAANARRSRSRSAGAQCRLRSWLSWRLRELPQRL